MKKFVGSFLVAAVLFILVAAPTMACSKSIQVAQLTEKSFASELSQSDAPVDIRALEAMLRNQQREEALKKEMFVSDSQMLEMYGSEDFGQ